MLQALINVFRIPELRNKILFTLGLLAVYRIGFWIPLPGVNQEELAKAFQNQGEGTALARISNFIAMFSGGNFSHSTIFGLGIMPYISASIIFQLLATSVPRLKKMQEEGPTGRQKILEWQRYATIGLCVIQGAFWLKTMSTQNMVYAEWASNPLWWIVGTAALTAGTVFLMWLGEQIDKHGIGNGVSMIIMAGILAQIPGALLEVIQQSPIRTLWVTSLFFGPAPADFRATISGFGVIMLLVGFVAVVGGSVLMTVAQRRIPVQQAKHTRGRKVFGGQRSYLPLRLNHSGVMPVVFASTLMVFPGIIFEGLRNGLVGWESSGVFATIIKGSVDWLSTNFGQGEFPYMVGEVLMIYFFSYFWITVQFNPEEMAKQLRDHGSFIPGLRPGPRTAEYLDAVMHRITYVGATMLAVIAVLPMVVNKALGIPYNVSQFIGGTGMLIVVSVVLDFIQRVEANLLMRDYAGFLGGEGSKGPRIQSPRQLGFSG
ncbi:MAG: preprotein translocase subunit SecY [Phycisphaerales bacterium]